MSTWNESPWAPRIVAVLVALASLAGFFLLGRTIGEGDDARKPANTATQSRAVANADSFDLALTGSPPDLVAAPARQRREPRAELTDAPVEEPAAESEFEDPLEPGLEPTTTTTPSPTTTTPAPPPPPPPPPPEPEPDDGGNGNGGGGGGGNGGGGNGGGGGSSFDDSG